MLVCPSDKHIFPIHDISYFWWTLSIYLVQQMTSEFSHVLLIPILSIHLADSHNKVHLIYLINYNIFSLLHVTNDFNLVHHSHEIIIHSVSLIV